MRSKCSKCNDEQDRNIKGLTNLRCRKCGSNDISLDVDAKLICPFCHNRDKEEVRIHKNKPFSVICGCFESRQAGQPGTWQVQQINSIHIKPVVAPKVISSSSSAHSKSQARRLEIQTKQLSTKPQIMVLVDKTESYLDIKAQNIKKYLSGEYDFHICYQNEYNSYDDNFDIYLTFGCEYVLQIPYKYSSRIISGVTASAYKDFNGYDEILGMCGAVHANSMKLFEEIKEFNENAFYCPDGVDEEFFSFKERDIRKRFNAGYFSQYSIDHSNSSNSSFKYRFIICDGQDYKRMFSLYESIDCIIITSDIDGPPNQLLEAAATGRTFVGVNTGNIPEFITLASDEFGKQNGFMVPNNIDAISEKLSWLKSNRRECRQMGINARETVENAWTWKKQVKNYKKLFDFVLNNIA